jgi:hypothetical protein
VRGLHEKALSIFRKGTPKQSETGYDGVYKKFYKTIGKDRPVQIYKEVVAGMLPDLKARPPGKDEGNPTLDVTLDDINDVMLADIDNAALEEVDENESIALDQTDAVESDDNESVLSDETDTVDLDENESVPVDETDAVDLDESEGIASDQTDADEENPDDPDCTDGDALDECAKSKKEFRACGEKPTLKNIIRVKLVPEHIADAFENCQRTSTSIMADMAFLMQVLINAVSKF